MIPRTQTLHLINGINYAQTEKYTFSYDAEKRLTSRNYYLQNQLANRIVLTYNSMGDQVIKKEYFEGGTLRQTVDFQYNIKGWLTKINDPDNFTGSGDYFSMQLYYDKQVNSNNSNLPRFNGNISFIRWQGVPPIGSINAEIAGLKGYDFRYDELNRLKTADYFNVDQGRFTRTSKYTEMLTYDKNGNINTLHRLGYIALKATSYPIDQLTYTYSGNQLKAVDDVVTTNNLNDFFDHGHYYYITRTPEYLYDANGNLIQDLNKEIVNITYNELNLPKIIDFKNNNRIEYQYDALGAKRRQIVSFEGKPVKTTDFIGNFVYENNIPVFNSYDEGRIVYKTNRTYYAETYLKDHLGNIRAVFGNDGSGYGVMQTSTYYPFGMEILTLTENSTSPNNKNEYKYNGKMLQDELGLGWLDYGFRMYDPQIGRWHVLDNLLEKYISISPYCYVNNNPINSTDFLGLDIINQHQKEKEEKEKKKDEANKKVNEYTGDNKSKEFKDLKKSARRANREFKKINNYYEHTQNAINDLKKYNPELYDKLDNLKDPGGTEVDVYIQSQDNLNTNSLGINPDFPEPQTVDGLTQMKPLANKGSYYSITSINGPNTVSVALNKSLFDPGFTLSHEGGHVIYNVAFFMAYYEWLRNNPGASKGGHGGGNPSGTAAEDEEEIYRKNKKIK